MSPPLQTQTQTTKQILFTARFTEAYFRSTFRYFQLVVFFPALGWLQCCCNGGATIGRHPMRPFVITEVWYAFVFQSSGVRPIAAAAAAAAAFRHCLRVRVVPLAAPPVIEC